MQCMIRVQHTSKFSAARSTAPMLAGVLGLTWERRRRSRRMGVGGVGPQGKGVEANAHRAASNGGRWRLPANLPAMRFHRCTPATSVPTKLTSTTRTPVSSSGSSLHSGGDSA